MLIWILTPECQFDITLSLRAPPLHFRRNEWQKCIKKKLNRMAACCFLFDNLCTVRQRPFRGCEGQGLKLTWNPPDRWVFYGTDEGGCRWADVTVLLQCSHLWYQLLLHYQLPSPSFGHSFLHLCLSPMRRQRGSLTMKCVTSLSLTPSN